MKKYNYKIILFSFLIFTSHCTKSIYESDAKDYIDEIYINYNQENQELFVQVKLFENDDNISIEGILNMNEGSDISFDLNDEAMNGDIISGNNSFSRLIAFQDENSFESIDELDYGNYSIDIYAKISGEIVEERNKTFKNEMQYAPEIISYNFYKILADKETQYLINKNDEGEYIYSVNNQDSSFIFFDINIRDENGFDNLFIQYKIDKDDWNRDDCEYEQSNSGYTSSEEWFFALNGINGSDFNYNIINTILEQYGTPGLTKFSIEDERCTGLGNLKLKFLITDYGLNENVETEDDEIILKFIKCGDGEWNCEEECSECFEECGTCD